MPKFKIKYVDPKNSEEEVWKEEILEFKDTLTITAFEWAEDYAYSMSDKGSYIIEELRNDYAKKE